MILGNILSLSAERYPQREAVVDGDRRFTYLQWNQRICRLANALGELGVLRGDKVVILLKNREEHAATYWALQKLGATATPINWRFSAGEVEYCVNDAAAKLIICEAASWAAVQEALPACTRSPAVVFVGPNPPAGTQPLENLVAAGTPDEPRLEIAESDASIMLYTSGTTGRPKGVPRSHKADYAAATAHCIQSKNTLGDRTLGVMPLYHTMGVRSMLVMAILNGCLVCLPDWSPVAAMALIQRERINSLYLVPTLYHDMINHPEFNKYDITSLKKLGYAGAPMSGALTDRLVELVHPEIFVNHYGSTEIYTFTLCDRIVQKPTCAGRPGINGQMRLVVPDPDRRVQPHEVVPRGEVGEIVFNMDSDESFKGYWNRPDANEKAIRAGWYFTGDLGYLDEEGDLYVVGRVDDMIISGGENIHPVEVEEVLLRHPLIKDACVVGLPDERWGQVVVAFIEPRDLSLTGDMLDEHCKATPDFANFKRPKQYVFVPAIPKSPTGKVLRRKLRLGEYEVL